MQRATRVYNSQETELNKADRRFTQAQWEASSGQFMTPAPEKSAIFPPNEATELTGRRHVLWKKKHVPVRDSTCPILRIHLKELYSPIFF